MVAGPNLKRALSDDDVMRILARVSFARAAAVAGGTKEPGEHAVRDALLRAGACSGDLAFYLSMIARGLNAEPSFTRAERLRRLRGFSDPFDFDVRTDASAKKTFGYAFTPRHASPNDLRAAANDAQWPRALSNEPLDSVFGSRAPSGHQLDVGRQRD